MLLLSWNECGRAWSNISEKVEKTFEVWLWDLWVADPTDWTETVLELSSRVQKMSASHCLMSKLVCSMPMIPMPGHLKIFTHTDLAWLWRYSNYVLHRKAEFGQDILSLCLSISPFLHSTRCIYSCATEAAASEPSVTRMKAGCWQVLECLMQADDEEVQSVEQAQRCTVRFAIALRVGKPSKHKSTLGLFKPWSSESFWVKEVCILGEEDIKADVQTLCFIEKAACSWDILPPYLDKSNWKLLSRRPRVSRQQRWRRKSFFERTLRTVSSGGLGVCGIWLSPWQRGGGSATRGAGAEH